jgi:hypothetical protein
MEPESSLPRSQELSTCTYPEPDQSSHSRGSYIFYTTGSQMAVRLSALFVAQSFSHLLISVRSWISSRYKLRLEGLGPSRNLLISSEIEPEAFRILAYCLNQLRYLAILEKHSGPYKDKSIQCRNYRLLGYKSPVPTSEEMHYSSATEPSRLMPCKI